MKLYVVSALLCFTVLVAPSAPTAADLGIRAFGARAGISFNPDQFVGGLHIDAGTFLPRLRFQPSFELGLGNGVLLLASNFDAHYLIPVRMRPYVGGGLGLNLLDVNDGIGQTRGFDFSLVLNLVGGLHFGSGRYLAEARAGLTGKTPDFKFVGGIRF